jgi:hypothetical protein
MVTSNDGPVKHDKMFFFFFFLENSTDHLRSLFRQPCWSSPLIKQLVIKKIQELPREGSQSHEVHVSSSCATYLV